MPTDKDYCLALQEIVIAVYDYAIEYEWDPHVHTTKAQSLRQKMDNSAQKLAGQLVGRRFSRAELDLIFDWFQDQ